MMRIIFTDYYTGEKIKQLTIKGHNSFRYGPETVRGIERFVCRDYYTGEVIRTCKMPEVSCRYEVIEIGY